MIEKWEWKNSAIHFSLLHAFWYAMGQTIISKQNFKNVIENISNTKQNSDVLPRF